MPITKSEIEVNERFFQSPKENSRIKALIVSEYFPQYCSIVMRKHIPKKFGYFDMFSGPGVYKDGTPSTPILIAKNCLDKEWLRQRVWMVFNDYYYSETLRKNFDAYIGIDSFPIRPHFGHSAVGECEAIDQFLTTSRKEGRLNECPTVLFFDPFGYEAIDTTVLCTFLQDWGNEIFLFFNTKRITPALHNPKFVENMQRIYPRTFEQTRAKWLDLPQKFDRLLFVVQSLKLEFELIMGNTLFCTPFQFMEDDCQGASHFLLHFTKNKRGFDLIKQIMDQYGTLMPMGSNGINTYSFDGKRLDNQINDMFTQIIQDDSIEKLANELDRVLARIYGGISALALFDEHQVSTQFSRRHYLQALRKLVAEDKITATFIDDKAHKVSVLLDDCCILESKHHGNE